MQGTLRRASDRTVGGFLQSVAMATLHVDCASCEARGPACSDCVISVLLGTPGVDFEETERAALTVLSQGGLLPPLRMAPPSDGRNVEAV